MSKGGKRKALTTSEKILKAVRAEIDAQAGAHRQVCERLREMGGTATEFRGRAPLPTVAALKTTAADRDKAVRELLASGHLIERGVWSGQRVYDLGPTVGGAR